MARGVRLDWEGRRAAPGPAPVPLRLEARFGAVSPESARGRLMVGDNLAVLDALLLGETERFSLIYADPPFASGADYYRPVRLDGDIDGPGVFEQRQYGDRWDLPDYLQFLADRLPRLRDLLTGDGLLFLHVGPGVAAHVRLLCDEVFGARRRIDEVIWIRQSAHSDGRQGARHLGRIHDVILIYGRSRRAALRPLYQPYEKSYVERFYRHREQDTGRRYMLDNLVGPGGAAKGNPAYELMGVTRHWRYSRVRMLRLVDEGRVVQTAPGRVPRYKRFLDEMPGRPLQDVWSDVPAVQVHAHERTGFRTQKPQALIERVLRLSTGEGDHVLDPFLGSGTTASVAFRLGRPWVGVELNPATAWLCVRRLCGAGSPGFELLDGGISPWASESGAVSVEAGPADGLRLTGFAPSPLLASLRERGEAAPDDWRELVEQVHIGTAEQDGVPRFLRHDLPPARALVEGAYQRVGDGVPHVVVVDRGRDAHRARV